VSNFIKFPPTVLQTKIRQTDDQTRLHARVFILCAGRTKKKPLVFLHSFRKETLHRIPMLRIIIKLLDSTNYQGVFVGLMYI